ncbi:MAG: metal ABC transporter solute-binding protein, Zn/Mn family [Saprospiraceae bacterium]
MSIRSITALGVCILLAFAKTSSAQAEEDDRPLVVSTASIFADMAEVIAGDVIQVKSIVPLGGDPHTYEPTPEAAKLVTSADLILRNGLTFEGWLNELIRYSGTKAPVTLITKGIEPLGSVAYEGSDDPHAWMNAGNGLIYARNIYRALALTFPEYADQFDFNYRLYRQEIEQLDAWIQDTVQVIPPQQRVLITSHDAFQYFGSAYGLRLEAILGTSTDADAQTSDVARVIKLIMESKVPSVFIETTVNPKLIRQIADDTGARIGGSLYSDSLGDEESPASTYLEMLRFNTRTIVNALSGANTNLSADDGFEEEEGSIPLLVGTLLAVFAIGFIIMFRYGQK